MHIMNCFVKNREGEELMKEKIKNVMKHFAEDDKGVGVVELILILVVLIGLVVIFREQLTSIIGDIFERIASESGAL